MAIFLFISKRDIGAPIYIWDHGVAYSLVWIGSLNCYICSFFSSLWGVSIGLIMMKYGVQLQPRIPKGRGNKWYAYVALLQITTVPVSEPELYSTLRLLTDLLPVDGIHSNIGERQPIGFFFLFLIQFSSSTDN